ncbi:hypothetical protein J2W49_001694 [Hydrogenophaga palleronii]|uniref:DUF4304 domain-containing protein n=1 Tax=Hydrogenophaga palleronii TaxID=65655 RepID=A0ABU1WL11_9BURK|nr:DUF4304 domain-containing protein [Hydrogenophaga palleronii]MDR7149739.1 hypothetical protein [Hydrogenophaga palleronii]
MDSKAVTKEIRGRIWPLLKEQGFTRFSSRTAWRDSEGQVDVVNFQSFNRYNADVMGVTPFSFSVNLGCYLTYVPPTWPPKTKEGQLMPQESECNFRGRLSPTVSQPGSKQSGVWSVDNEGRNLPWSIQDVVGQLPEVHRWFGRLSDRSEVLRVLLEDGEDMELLWGFGRRPSPIRSYMTGYVALSMGMQDLAREKLDEAVASKCFTALFDSVEGAINRAI